MANTYNLHERCIPSHLTRYRCSTHGFLKNVENIKGTVLRDFCPWIFSPNQRHLGS
jgi:hypothetical protein